MRVLYISYWSINDPLTISSVMPTLWALKRHLALDRLTLVTVERRNAEYPKYTIPYDFVDHVPLEPMAQGIGLVTKAYEMLALPRKIEKICIAERIDVIFARCTLAGGIAYKIHQRTGLPFIVESFEPHSEYMVNCGAWVRGGWKYRYARKFERRQMASARKLITVAKSYRDYLIAHEGIEPKRIAVIPCVTDLNATKFDASQREVIRNRLGLGGAITGIYAGKFGGLYYDEDAFRILRDAFDYFDDFRVVLLTPTPEQHIRARLKAHGISLERVHTMMVARPEVPAYLSAADFAYSFHRPHGASAFLSPIKHAEYWACGLPFIAPDRIGDDWMVIANEGGGANLNHALTNVRECHELIASLIAKPDYRESIRRLAVRYKDSGLIDPVLSEIFKG